MRTYHMYLKNEACLTSIKEVLRAIYMFNKAKAGDDY